MNEIEKLFNEHLLMLNVGCADNSCALVKRGGMSTNGGCQCLKQEKTQMLKLTLRLQKNIITILSELLLEKKDMSSVDIILNKIQTELL